MLGKYYFSKVAYGTFMVLMMACLQGCRHAVATSEEVGESVRMKYAQLIEIEDFDGYSKVSIRNPWDTAHNLQTIILLEEGREVPAGYSMNEILRVPLEKSVVFSSVHADLIEELGAAERISGVCDAEYIYSPATLERLRSGMAKDCGSSMSPNVEAIIAAAPGAVLLSPYENGGGHTKIDRAGIPVVECADYMEKSPLARAEWMRFYGRLYGKGERADSLFGETVKSYLAVKEKTADVEACPKVMLDRVYSGVWDVPGGDSYMGKLIEDAGGENPFGERDVAGSYALSPERVLMTAGDADIWLIRHYGEQISYETLGADRPVYRQFKPYKERRIYVSDTSRSRVFEDAAFHPQLILTDLSALFHPEAGMESEKKYYTPLR